MADFSFHSFYFVRGWRDWVKSGGNIEEETRKTCGMILVRLVLEVFDSKLRVEKKFGVVFFWSFTKK